MSVNLGLWEQTNNLSGLSPPSESRLMQRRKSVHNSNSLQLNRISSAGSKVTSIQVAVNALTYVISNCFFTGPDSPGTDRFAIVLKLLHPLLLVSTISPPACSSAKGSLESSWQPTLPLGGSGYYNMRN